jgi:hypothetical protein
MEGPDLDLIREMESAGVGLAELTLYARACLSAEERELLARRLLDSMQIEVMDLAPTAASHAAG